jgi:hypothetical protein
MNQKQGLKESNKVQPPKIEPKPMGTPEEVDDWANRIAEKTVQGMRSRPKNFIPPY